MRRLAAILAFLAGLLPAIVAAQAPPAVPTLPDTERRTSYSLTASTCACSVGFALFEDSNDVDQQIEVWLDGVKYLSNDSTHGWTLTSITGSLATIPRPITNAVLTFNAAQTGTVQIVGAQRPRRLSQFAENRGVAARDLNQVITYLTAMERERWDFRSRTLYGPPGETITVMPSAASRAGSYLGFDSSGNPVALPATDIDPSFCTTVGAFVVRGASALGCRAIVGSDLPNPATATLGGTFKLAYGDSAAAINGPYTTTSVLAGIDSNGNPQRAAVTGSAGPVVLKFSPQIDSPNFLTAGYLASVKFFDSDATYRYIYGPGAATFLQFSTTNAYVKRDNTTFTSGDGVTTFADISSGGWNFYASGGVFYHGSSSGTHHVVAAPAAGSGTSTWPTTTGTIVNTGATNAVTNAMLSNMANSTVKCRTTAGTGAPEDCTAAQVIAINKTTQINITATGIDFNSANTDTTLTIPAPPSGYTRYSLRVGFIEGASASLTTATFGVFTATGGGGVALVASGTAITVSTASEDTLNNMQALSPVNVNTTSHLYSSLTSGQIYFRVQTAEGSAATASVMLVIQYLP